MFVLRLLSISVQVSQKIFRIINKSGDSNRHRESWKKIQKLRSGGNVYLALKSTFTIIIITTLPSSLVSPPPSLLEPPSALLLLSLLVPLKYIFDLSLNKGTFPEKMKIARVTPVFKYGDTSLMTNYRPISVLPCFSKMLERIMYNRLYKYLTKNNLLYCKQFGFQKGTLQSIQFFS